MTNNQAIEELKQIPFHEKATEKRLKPIYEAIDIAIKALDITNEPKFYDTNNKSQQVAMMDIQLQGELSVLVNKYLHHVPTSHITILLEEFVEQLNTVAELQREI